jgi:hypothetical protein
MTDFDNGLPPEGTTTEAKLSSVTLDSKSADSVTPTQVQGVTYNTLPAEAIQASRITAVLIAGEEYGVNFMGMM